MQPDHVVLLNKLSRQAWNETKPTDDPEYDKTSIHFQATLRATTEGVVKSGVAESEFEKVVARLYQEHLAEEKFDAESEQVNSLIASGEAEKIVEARGVMERADTDILHAGEYHALPLPEGVEPSTSDVKAVGVAKAFVDGDSVKVKPKKSATKSTAKRVAKAATKQAAKKSNKSKVKKEK